MAGIKFVSKGDFSITRKFLNTLASLKISDVLKRFGDRGVEALRAHTPIDSAITANSWGYEIEEDGDSCTISWTNSNIIDNVPIAIILQYGHGTNHGGYVVGRDYINPALKPIFDEIADAAWQEVTKA